MVVNCGSNRNPRVPVLPSNCWRSLRPVMNSSLTTINLLLVDDHEMFREGLARSLEKKPGFKLIGHCGSSAEAMSLLPDGSDADHGLLDVDLGPHRGLKVLEA